MSELPYYIRFVERRGNISFGNNPRRGAFLQAFDADYHNGGGMIWWTDEPTKALTFKTQGEAIEVWQMQSIVKPRRSDGKPNKPFTSCTVEITQKIGPL